MNRPTKHSFSNSRWNPIQDGKIYADDSSSTPNKAIKQDAPPSSKQLANKATLPSISTTVGYFDGELGKISSSSSSTSRRRRRRKVPCSRTTTSVKSPNLTSDLWQIDQLRDVDADDENETKDMKDDTRVRFDLSKNESVAMIDATSSNCDRDEREHDVDLKSVKWYCKSDYIRINKETQATIRQIQRGLPERFGFCFRGLEHEVYPGSCTIRINNAQTVVLLHSNVCDREVLASRYAAATKDCQEIAYQIGVADARIAQKIQLESSSGSRDQMPKPPQRRWGTKKPSRLNSVNSV